MVATCAVVPKVAVASCSSALDECAQNALMRPKIATFGGQSAICWTAKEVQSRAWGDRKGLLER